VSVRVFLPPVLRAVTGGRRDIEADGATLSEVLAGLGRANPALALHFFDETGTVRRHIVCVHGGEAVRAKDFASHGVRDGDEVAITNALAGG